MELNSALVTRYSATATRTAASSRYARTVLARTSTVNFPSQIALVGEISERFRLVHPIAVNIEHDDAGKIVVSDDVFYMYGEGVTRQLAVEDYVSSLAEYYDLLKSQEDAPSIDLFLYLQRYLQPI